MFCFVVNFLMMYIEYVFFECFVVVVYDGFKVVEYLFLYDFVVEDICVCFDVYGFEQVLFNVLLGDWVVGECGIVLLLGCEDEFCCGIDQVFDYVCVIGNRKLYVMVGMVVLGVDCVCYCDIYLVNLCYVVQVVVVYGIMILIELINQCDMFGYFLSCQDDVQVICVEIGVLNLKVQFDCYYCQIVEGDFVMKFKCDFVGIGYIQIVGVFECYELDVGEFNYLYLFVLIDVFGYDGWIGCEYWLKVGMLEGFGWFKLYL